MQGGSGDRGAAELHRFQFRHRGDDSGSTHLKRDGVQTGLGLFRGIFVGNRPAGGLVGGAENFLLVEPVDLDHCSVRGEGKFGAGLIEGADGLENLLGSPDMTEPRMTGQSPGRDLLVEVDLIVDLGTGSFAQPVKNNGQWTLGHLAGIEKFECAGGRIAWVGKEGFALLLPRSVHGVESGLGEINLAPEFDHRRQAGNGEGKGADGF